MEKEISQTSLPSLLKPVLIQLTLFDNDCFPFGAVCYVNSSHGLMPIACKDCVCFNDFKCTNKLIDYAKKKE